MNEIWLKYEFVWTCRAKPWKTSKSNGWDRKGLTDKQIKTVALLACPLQIAFRDRGNKDSHWIEPIWTQQGVRTIYVGSGGCRNLLLIRSSLHYWQHISDLVEFSSRLQARPLAWLVVELFRCSACSSPIFSELPISNLPLQCWTSCICLM